MKIDIQITGMKELISKMSDLEKRQVPFAMAKALTKTAQQVQAEEVKVMQRTLDRPTPYTLKALYVKPATKADLSSAVYFKDKSSAGKGNPAANWMLPQVAGGKRSLKRFESALRNRGILPHGMFVAPGSACPTDAYGNIPGSFIVKILSYFKSFGEQGYRANITDERKGKMWKGTRTKRGEAFFFSRGPGHWYGRDQHLPAGIYQRIQFVGGTAIKPIMMFVKEPSYSKRFPFYETAQKIINQNLNRNFSEAMRDAIRTAK